MKEKKVNPATYNNEGEAERRATELREFESKGKSNLFMDREPYLDNEPDWMDGDAFDNSNPEATKEADDFIDSLFACNNN